MNTTMGAKLVWMMFKGNQKRARMPRRKYLDSKDPINIINTRDPLEGSSIWNFICDSREIITKHTTWEVHNGHKASF